MRSVGYMAPIRPSSRPPSGGGDSVPLKLPPIPRPPSADDIIAARSALVLLKARMGHRARPRRDASVEPPGARRPPSPGLGQRGHSVPPPAVREQPQEAFRGSSPSRRIRQKHGALPDSNGRASPAAASGRAAAVPAPVAVPAPAPAPVPASPYGGVNGGGRSVDDEQREEEAAEGDLVPCQDCGRSFNPDSLERHRKICKKVFCGKRKQFNSAAARLGELENAEQLISNARKLELEREREAKKAALLKEKEPIEPAEGSKAKPLPKWKQQSLAFRAQLLAGKAASGDEEAAAKCAELKKELVSGTPLGPPEGMVACPHCNRTFNKESAERHINICLKTFCSKPGGGGGRLMAGGGKQAVAMGGASKGGVVAASAAAVSAAPRGLSDGYGLPARNAPAPVAQGAAPRRGAQQTGSAARGSSVGRR